MHLSLPVPNLPLTIANRQFNSRLMMGTGKFASGELMRDAIVASETEIVTVALRRADLTGKGDPFANILDFIPKNVLLLPNTSGAMNAEEAVRLARLAALHLAHVARLRPQKHAGGDPGRARTVRVGSRRACWAPARSCTAWPGPTYR